MIYDIIGDVHGHAAALKKLLIRLGYREIRGCFRPSESGRMAVFLGDFVDRGPEIPEALRIVRTMTDSGFAHAIMGNHEYNAICFHTPASGNVPGEAAVWLRARTDKHVYQHIETLYQFRDARSTLSAYIDWFRTLPLYLEFPAFRVIHAAWVEDSLEVVKGYSPAGNLLTSDLLVRSSQKGTTENRAVERILKGVRLVITDDKGFYDKDGNWRTTMRTRWWDDPRGKSYRDIGFPPGNVQSTAVISEEDVLKVPGYSDGKPVFIGHYWLKDVPPAVQSTRVCCLDYSVAKGGYLAAYTFRGEAELSSANIIWV